MKNRRKLLYISLFLVLLTIYMPLTKKPGAFYYELGYPFHYITYLSTSEIPQNKLLIFWPTNWPNLSIEVIPLFINMLIIYWVLRMFIKLFRRIIDGTNFNASSK